MDNITVSKLTRRIRCDFSSKEFAAYAIGPANKKQLYINVCESCAKGMLEGLSEVLGADGTNEADVEIDVEVAGVPADEGQEPKDGEPGDEPKDDAPKDEVKATDGTNEASAENIYVCRYCGKTFDKTPEELKTYRAHSMTCARMTKAAEEAAKAAAAGAE
jgi:hypothetical protein